MKNTFGAERVVGRAIDFVRGASKLGLAIAAVNLVITIGNALQSGSDFSNMSHIGHALDHFSPTQSFIKELIGIPALTITGGALLGAGVGVAENIGHHQFSRRSATSS